MKKNEYIIIQAGGKGTRLEALTTNKPKALVPLDNMPIIFHLFKVYPNAKFKIIGDYKADVFEKYLKCFAKIDYEFIKAPSTGTISGINEALESIPENTQFTLIWCDLIFNKAIEIPDSNKNYIGLSSTFECRWSFKNGKCVKQPSSDNGIAGLFIFKNKNELKNLGNDGSFVGGWLSKQNNIELEVLDLGNNVKEIGTMMAYQKEEVNTKKCRPFNKIEFYKDRIIKYPITKQGEDVAKNEINWYKFIEEKNYTDIPEIFNYCPLELERISGDNIFEYENFSKEQKIEIIRLIIDKLKSLHNLVEPIKANNQDCIDNYITKTFERLEQVKDLIPFAKDKYININGKKYENIFYHKDFLISKISKMFPTQFNLIHGDPTFSNILINEKTNQPVLIDPRGVFGSTKLYGDIDYDWAKLYYSVQGDYDQFNRKRFMLNIKENEIIFNISSNNWSEVSDYLIKESGVNKDKLEILHAIIWFSLTTYASEDYDSICGAFYKGIIELDKVINKEK